MTGGTCSSQQGCTTWKIQNGHLGSQYGQLGLEKVLLYGYLTLGSVFRCEATRGTINVCMYVFMIILPSEMVSSNSIEEKILTSSYGYPNGCSTENLSCGKKVMKAEKTTTSLCCNIYSPPTSISTTKWPKQDKKWTLPPQPKLNSNLKKSTTKKTQEVPNNQLKITTLFTKETKTTTKQHR